jgi:hypothetical protein
MKVAFAGKGQAVAFLSAKHETEVASETMNLFVGQDNSGGRFHTSGAENCVFDLCFLTNTK